MMRCEIIIGSKTGDDSVKFEGSGSTADMMKFLGAIEKLKYQLLKTTEEIDTVSIAEKKGK